MVRKLAAANLVLLAILLASATVNVLTNGVVAQTFGGFFNSLQVVATDPVLGGDPNDRRAVDFSCTTNTLNSNSNFSAQNCMQIEFTANHGQDVYGAGTNAKTTFLPLSIFANYVAAGQKFISANTINCGSIGDCAVWANNGVTFSGGPAAGDEGTGWGDVSALTQQPGLTLTTIGSVPAKTTCSTTLTQNVTGGYAVQSVTVAGTTGCNVNDWVVVNQILPGGDYGYPNNEAVQITAVGSGTISGQFQNNQSSGATITPALVLDLGSTTNFGEGRKLVNLSQPSYSAGTVSAINGGAFTGTGTNWNPRSDGGGPLTGGTQANIGCIALAADDYNGTPFSGSGAQGTLKSWYEITGVTSTTLLGVSSMSVAGDLAYHGQGPGPGGSGDTSSAYVIRPCAEVLRVNPPGSPSGTVIAESTSTTWSPGDNVELAISPYPDVTGYQDHMAAWTPGGALRGYRNVVNTGARRFAYGFNVNSNMATGSNADATGWGFAYLADTVDVGFSVTNSARAAIALPTDTSAHGLIAWGPIPYIDQAHIAPNVATGGLEIQFDLGQSYPGKAGFLTAYGHNSSAIGPSASLTGLNFGGVFGTAPKTFSQLMPCNSGLIAAFGTITGGSGYANGSYSNVSLTGGAGTLATADITVAGGAVTAVAIGGNPGINYAVGNSLSATFGGGSGFAVPVAALNSTEGFESAVTDSTTATFAATITGGGSNHVKAYCNGANWTVH